MYNPFSKSKSGGLNNSSSTNSIEVSKPPIADPGKSEKVASNNNPPSILKRSSTEGANSNSTPATVNQTTKGKIDNPDTKVAVDPKLGKNAKLEETIKPLNPDAIVDIKISLSESPIESDLSKNGYIQLLPNDISSRQRKNKAVLASTFSNKYSLWTWTREQGVCSGRLKPIIEMQLETTGTSTDLVICGFTCIPEKINGKWLWIKV